MSMIGQDHYMVGADGKPAPVLRSDTLMHHPIWHINLQTGFIIWTGCTEIMLFGLLSCVWECVSYVRQTFICFLHPSIISSHNLSNYSNFWPVEVKLKAYSTLPHLNSWWLTFFSKDIVKNCWFNRSRKHLKESLTRLLFCLAGNENCKITKIYDLLWRWEVTDWEQDCPFFPSIGVLPLTRWMELWIEV